MGTPGEVIQTIGETYQRVFIAALGPFSQILRTNSTFARNLKRRPSTVATESATRSTSAAYTVTRWGGPKFSESVRGIAGPADC